MSSKDKPSSVISDDKQYSLDKIKTDPRNPRTHDAKNIHAITESLLKFGQHRPLVVQKSSNIILIGNGMYQSMRNLGWKHAWVAFVNDTDAQAIARKIADNKTGELGNWDEDILSDLVGELSDLTNGNGSIPGFNSEELEALADNLMDNFDGLASDPDLENLTGENIGNDIDNEDDGLEGIKFDQFNEVKLVLTKEEQSIIEQFFSKHKGSGRPEKFLISLIADDLGIEYIVEE